MYKIIYIVSSLKKSGPTEVLLNLISHLDRSVFLPIIITLSPETSSSSFDDFKKLGVEIINLNLNRGFGMLLLKSRLNKLIDFHKPDLLHSQGLRPDLIVSIFFNRHRFFSTIHNNPFIDYVFKFGNFYGFIIANVHKKFVKKYPRSYVAVSDAIVKVYLNKKIQISSIKNGVNSDYFLPASAKRKKTLRQRLNIPVNQNVFLSSGRVVKSKNIITTIKGFNKYNTGNSILLIIGDGDERLKLAKFETETVRFIGYTESILDYYQLSDFLISSSLTEGFPMAVLEGMATGLVPILSNIEPHEEIFNDLSIPMFSPMDYINLSDCLKDAKINQEKYRQSCLMLIKNKFNSKIMSEKYQERYLQSLK